jgi:hypothetical protein
VTATPTLDHGASVPRPPLTLIPGTSLVTDFDEDTVELLLTPAQILALSQAGKDAYASRIGSLAATQPKQRDALPDGARPPQSVNTHMANLLPGPEAVLTRVDAPVIASGPPAADSQPTPSPQARQNGRPVPIVAAQSTCVAAVADPAASDSKSSNTPAGWRPQRSLARIGLSLAVTIALVAVGSLILRTTEPSSSLSAVGAQIPLDAAATASVPASTGASPGAVATAIDSQAGPTVASKGAVTASDRSVSNAAPISEAATMPLPASTPRAAPTKVEPATSIEVSATGEPVRFQNPFDPSEVFEFPPGTSLGEARNSVATLLLERAQERRARVPTTRGR